MITTTVTYSAMSMEQISQSAETVDAKQTANYQKSVEEFEILSVGNANNKFNMTVTNSGDAPVYLTRLWVENTTDSAWPMAKYDLNYVVPSGGTVTDIGQSIGLAALDSQSYELNLVSERGNTEKVLSNSVGDESLYLNLRATPTIVSTGFTTTLVLEVINTGTDKLYNLQANLYVSDENCASSCSADIVSGPLPVSFASLDPGDIATFEWVYTLNGATDGDDFTFTANLVNGVDTATANVSIKVVETAQNAAVSFEAGKVDSDSELDKSILLFHLEQDRVPSSGYQMFSSSVDGGSNGLKIDMEGKTAALGAFSVFTNNGSTGTITIDPGNWNVSLALRSEAVATGIQDQTEDMIFHMEDGDGVDPDNSQGDANRDLETCGGAAADPWCNLGSTICDGNWDNRFAITVDNTQVSGSSNLSNFPMLVHITGTDFTNNLDDAADTLEDIRFTSAAGALLDYEIEKFSKADDELVAWVEVPTLDYNDDTIIYMYYDNAGSPPDQQNAAGTWDSNYVMVHHMNEASSNIIDSTSNDNDSDAVDGSPTYGATGKVGDAIDFPGNAGFEIPDDNSLDLTSAVTIQAWVKNSETGSYPVILNKGSSEPYVMFIWSGSSPNNCPGDVRWGMTMRVSTPERDECTSGTDVTDNAWHMVTGRYDGTNNQIWVNGVQDGTESESGSMIANTDKVTIGMYDTATALPYDGLIDELHVSNIARSDGWITTTYNNQNSPSTFYSLTVQSTGGGVDPDWRPGEGPHNSGAYYYDGVNECHQSKNDVSSANGNDIGSNDVSTSLWFKTDGVDQVSSEQMLVFWEGGGEYPNSEYYKISLGEDGTGKILFEHELSTSGTKTTTCRSVNEYDDGLWHHVVAVRTVSGDRCDLYITNSTGSVQETRDSSPSHSGSADLDADGKWFIGSRENSDNYFKGWIDDVMHWNSDALDSTEADLLSHTNYGDTAHQFEVNLDLTDGDGNVVSNLYNAAAVAIPFVDAKSQADTVDAAYQITNVTMSLPQIQVASNQRLNFSMAFIPSTSTWEPLNLDMKLDDDGFTDPYPSYLQIPSPNIPFPAYVVYDPTDELILYVNNSGEDGIYFIYSGTRIAFDDGTASYASQIHYVNGTSNVYAVDVDSDSIYIPSGQKAELHFYAQPTNHPCQGAGQTCSDATIVPDGIYRMAAWINGYTDQGEDFGRSVVLGYIVVEDT